MNSDKHLDEQIKLALERLQARFDNRAWEAFEQHLDQDVANGESPFDEVISNKLNRLEVPLAMGDWSQMEKMIEAEETAELLENEAVVDNLVFEKFENFEVAFQPHHWQMMAHRLEEEFFFRYHLLRCKAAEAALMLLLLLTIVHYTPLLNSAQGGDNFQQATFSQQPNKIQVENPTHAAPGNTLKTTLPNRPIAANTSVGKQLPIAQASKSRKSGAEQLKDDGLTAPNLPPLQNDFERINDPMEALPSGALNGVSRVGTPVSLFESMTEKRFLENNLTTPNMVDGNHANTPAIASLNAQPLLSKYAWEVPQLPGFIFEKENQLRFSIFTSTDVAYVITPPNKYSVFDTLVAVNADTTLASGYGAGITVSWKKDRWEFQTGGIYSFKRYIPNTPAFLFETLNYYIREEFNGVQLDMLELPFNAIYHIKNEGKWRFYGNIGASGHFITSSVYEIKTDRTPSFSNFAMLPRAEGLPEDNKSIREEKQFPDGLFDGGNIHDNFYLTANLGLGMERFVSPRWSVFLQPNYQHHFLTDGIGVNGEKLYNFSFYLGTKVSLK